MSIYFQSLRSGSSGNCLMLWSDRTRVLIDCGLSSQRRCMALLCEHAGAPPQVDAVLVTHSHSDHVNYPSLRVLGKLGVPVFMHGACIDQTLNLYLTKTVTPHFAPFDDLPFAIGDFTFQAVPLQHAPGVQTFGFVVCFHGRGRARKLAIMTDLKSSEGLLPHAADAHFLFIESNYDRELLYRKYYQSAEYHLQNEAAADLIVRARRWSRRPPCAVMLGHISVNHNTHDLAREAVGAAFRELDLRRDFDLLTAPRYEPSRKVLVAE